ncbi:MAG: UDP-N-acetylglucosamine--N-acetylmuramyl-(pentapeptide) pyrophosphoryl-undecaprenol N-acetylglucosamine transferase [Synergistaceae bacterium]|jgi:UDP-N-acetylglucosamine--N-acetylmuramyl-(pentapeptide) pyrophosphoryl-undecaprenol N-acetylglucosamine transferase|nr:UDP-N-acetylglucosamine--N-acetylmuramyl-(pentapeptide) pyrophosphoryl-undecaprenol N-acetylglucosamine transferase [Synergistaceae bacterium]
MKGRGGEISRVVLAAGGTGGHIMPAIAFGGWLKREYPDIDLTFISGSRPIELEIYRVSDIEPLVVSASGSPIGASGFKMLERWAELFRSFFEARRWLKKISPDICILFGGYVSLPVMLAGKLCKVRSILHEQNARAGRAARIASFMKIPVASGWKECEPIRRDNYMEVGVPIRRFRNMDKDEARRLLGIPAENCGPVTAVMTGSLGSGNMLDIIGELAKTDGMSSWRFLAVDSSADSPRAEGNVTLLPRMWDITPLYAAADIVMARGGASTLSEIISLGVPAVIAPWRGAADDHQMKNARAAADGKRIVIWDELEDPLNDLAEKLLKLQDLFGDINGSTEKMLYNANVSGETFCRKLLCYAIASRKGEVELEG